MFSRSVSDWACARTAITHFKTSASMSKQFRSCSELHSNWKQQPLADWRHTGREACNTTHSPATILPRQFIIGRGAHVGLNWNSMSISITGDIYASPAMPRTLHMRPLVAHPPMGSFQHPSSRIVPTSATHEYSLEPVRRGTASHVAATAAGLSVSSFYLAPEDVGVGGVAPPGGTPTSSPLPVPPLPTAAVSAASSDAHDAAPHVGDREQWRGAPWSRVSVLSPSLGGRKSARRQRSPINAHQATDLHHDAVGALAAGSLSGHSASAPPHEATQEQRLQSPRKRQAKSSAHKALNKQCCTRVVHATQPRRFAAALSKALTQAVREGGSSDCASTGSPALWTEPTQPTRPASLHNTHAASAVQALLGMKKARGRH